MWIYHRNVDPSHHNLQPPGLGRFPKKAEPDQGTLLRVSGSPPARPHDAERLPARAPKKKPRCAAGITTSGTTLPPNAPVPTWHADVDTGLAGPSGPFTGRIIADRYLVLERLDESELPERYRVLHIRMQKELALEIFPPEVFARKVLGQEATRSAQAEWIQSRLETVSLGDADALLCPNDSGRLATGAAWMVFDRLTTRTLQCHLAEQGPLSPHTAISLGRQVAKVLEAATQAGWTYDTLRPEHVLLQPSPGGSWRALVGHLGRPGGAEGAGGVGDERTSVWALGALLYQALGGHVPFPSGSSSSSETRLPSLRRGPRIWQTHRLRRLPGNTVPAALNRVVLKALQPHPRDRFPTVNAMARALRALCPALESRKDRRRTTTSTPPQRWAAWAAALETTRDVIWGAAVGGAVVLALAWALHPAGSHTALHAGAGAIRSALAAEPTGPRRAALPVPSRHSSLAPNDPALAQLATWIRNGRVHDAVALRDRLVDRHPRCARLRLLSGELERLRRHPGAALFAYRRAAQLHRSLRRDPRFVRGVLALTSAAHPSRRPIRQRRRGHARALAARARALAARYLGPEAAPEVTRLVNTRADPRLIAWGIAFLRRHRADQQVDYPRAYGRLLASERACAPRLAAIRDISRRRDPRFAPLLEKVLAAPFQRAPARRVWVSNRCIRTEARRVLAELRRASDQALASTD